MPKCRLQPPKEAAVRRESPLGETVRPPGLQIRPHCPSAEPVPRYLHSFKLRLLFLTNQKFIIMSPNETSKPQVLMQLGMLNAALQMVVNQCGSIKDAANQLEVFSVVAKHLPSLVDVFSSIQKRLDSGTAEADDAGISDKYPVIRQAALACCERSGDLQGLFHAVSESRNKTEAYRNAVECGKGEPLEMVMMDMLQNAISVATPPLVEDEQVTALNNALEEIKKLPPSLGNEPLSARIALHNHGAGNQFYHGGKGNMNHCSGGFQVTGDNHGATYNHGPMGNK
ncbi:SesA domain-containing protein [Fusarium keratoplasticum]|uniref:SesA domain-containing protein n=1 Tax=Fusarium keratoplasticum TaxID=1328300 RepID=A0ACC0R7L8_9HYPO|nr:SesA domain-containing protein [Fusarium keratoplasticum]KAI8675557.1 SesA domain-containing protein [Fusarium keratoplasticum]KAI8682022.1 SesA domain-containing protein [Fusarium keratoplasticum]